MGPWGQFAKVHCYPNCACEFIDVTAWIAQPQGAWSSLIYWVVALYFVYHRGFKSELRKLWSFALFFMGISSFLCHATWVKLAGAMDFTSITVLLSFFAFFHYVRKHRFLYLITYMMGLTSFFYFIGGWPRIVLVSGIFLFTLWEIRVAYGAKVYQDKSLQRLIILYLSSFTLFLLDESEIICNPHGWFFGHTFWHMGSAFVLALYGNWRFKKS